MAIQQPNFAKTRDQISRVQDELSDQLAELQRTDDLFYTFQWNTLAKVNAYQVERYQTIGVEVLGGYTEGEMEAAVGPVDSKFFTDGEQREPAGYRTLAKEYYPDLIIQELDLLNQEQANIYQQLHGAQGPQGPQGQQPIEDLRQIIIAQEVVVLDGEIAELTGWDAIRVAAAQTEKAFAIASLPGIARLDQIRLRIEAITPSYEKYLLDQEYINITHGGGESARQALITKEVTALNTVISAMSVHHGTEATPLAAAIQAKADALSSHPDPSRLDEITNRIAYITSRGGDIGFSGSVSSEYYDESDSWLSARLSRERGSLQQIYYAGQNQQLWNRVSGKVTYDGAAESEVGEYLFLLDEQNILADELTEISTDPDSLGTTPIRTGSVLRLLISYQNQQTALGQELTMGERLHTDERANAATEKGTVNALLLSTQSRLTHLSQFYKPLAIRQDQEIRKLFDKNLTTLTDGFLLSIVSPTTVTIVNAYDGMVDLAAESAAKAPAKDALEAQLKALYDALADATTEAQRKAIEASIRAKEAEILAVSRVTIVYKYVDNPIVFNETLLPDANGNVVVKAAPLVSVLEPPNGKIGDPQLGVINIPEHTGGAVTVQYSANMATLFGTMTTAEKVTRHAEIVARQAQVVTRRAQLNAIFARRNFPTPVLPPYQGPQGSQGTQGPRSSVIDLYRDGPQGLAGYQGPQGNFIGVQGWQGNQGYQGTNPGPQGVTGPQGLGTQGSSGPQGTNGSIGVDGVQGPQGLSGYGGQGPQGRQGLGNFGAQGWQGDVGNQGYQGENPGPQGDPGPQGRQGSQGTGAQGVQGHQGNQGRQGTQGWQGTGVQGWQGDNPGSQGPQGVQGFQGDQGFRGDQGPRGYQGAGVQGPQGWQGFQGFQGTGAQGYQGNQGRQGWQGAGAQGYQGFQGWQGRQGAQGWQGPQGWQGSGVQGAQGNQGNQGVQGWQGIGAQGWQGDNPGSQGSQGPQGPQGWQGQVGSQGPQGWQGKDGTQGFQGFQGTGVQGAQGWQGFQGTGGVQGNQGWQGSGIQGWQGDLGSQGWQGENPGPQGDPGTQGSQGVQGWQGTGADGAQGAQGNQGAVGSGSGSVIPSFSNFRLTLESGVDVSTTDQTAKTVVYLTPSGGAHMSAYDGAAWQDVVSAEISINLTDVQNGTTSNGFPQITALTSTAGLVVGMEVTGTGIAGSSVIASIDSTTQVTMNNNATANGTNSMTFKVPASKVLDLFIYYVNATTMKLAWGPIWTSATVRATALTTQNSVSVLSGAYSVAGTSYAQGKLKHVGTVCTFTTAGQTQLTLGRTPAAGGSNPKLGFWNRYNRVRFALTDRESTHSWARAADAGYRWYTLNASNTNRLEFVLGDTAVDLRCSFMLVGGISGAASQGYWNGGIGLDTNTGALPNTTANGALSPAPYTFGYSPCFSRYDAVTAAGYHYLQLLEMPNNASPTTFTADAGLSQTQFCQCWAELEIMA